MANNVRLRVSENSDGEWGLRAGPQENITDELRDLIRENRDTVMKQLLYRKACDYLTEETKNMGPQVAMEVYEVTFSEFTKKSLDPIFEESSLEDFTATLESGVRLAFSKALQRSTKERRDRKKRVGTRDESPEPSPRIPGHRKRKSRRFSDSSAGSMAFDFDATD